MPREPIFRERTSGLREPGREGKGRRGEGEQRRRQSTKSEVRSTKYQRADVFALRTSLFVLCIFCYSPSPFLPFSPSPLLPFLRCGSITPKAHFALRRGVAIRRGASWNLRGYRSLVFAPQGDRAMRVFSCSILVLLAAGLTATAPPAASENLDSVLRGWEKAMTDLKSFYAEVERTSLDKALGWKDEHKGFAMFLKANL